MASDIGIRLSLDGAGQVQGGLTAVGNTLGQLDSKALKVGDAFKSFGSMLAGALSVGAIGAFLKGAIDAADETFNLSQKVGIAAKDLGGLQLAFKQAGVDSGAMQTALVKLSKNVAEGNDSFKAMGLSLKNTDGSLKGSKQVLGEVADVFQKMPDGVDKTTLATELFGKAGADLIPMLNGGSAGLDEMAAMAERLGLVIDDQTAASADQFNDTVELLGMSLQGVGRQVAAQMLPTLTRLAGSLLDSATKGDTLKRVADILATALRGLYSVAVGIVEVFNTVGKAIGGTIAAVMAALQGDFAGAKQILAESASDIKAGWSSAGAAIANAWEDSADSSVLAAAKVVGAGDRSIKSAKDLATEQDKAAKAAAAYAAEGVKLAGSLVAQENGLSGDFFEKWGKLKAALAAGKIGSDQFEAAQAKLLEQQPYMKAALKEQEAATKALEESKKSYLQAFEMVREAELAEVEDLQKLVAKQREHNATLGLTAEQLRQVESNRLSEALAIAEQNLQLKLSEGLQGADLERYTLKVEALRELIKLRGEGAAKEAVLEEAKTARDAWAETVKSIQDGLTDALYRAFESGQGFLQAFKNLLVNTFKTTVLKPIIQAVMAPVTGAVGSLMGAGNAVAGTGSMLSGAGSLLGAASTFGSGLGAGFSALLGEAGFSGAMSAGSIAIGAGNIAGGLGTLIGAMGPIALGIGAIAALAKALGGGGTPHVGAAFTASTDGSPSKMLTPGNAGGWQIGTTWSAAGKTSKAMQDTVQVFTESLAATVGTALRTFGLQPGSVRAGFTADNDDPSAGRITIRDATGRVLADMTKRYAASASKGFEEFAADAGKVLRDALVAADLPAEVDRMLTNLGDTPSLEAVQLKIQRLSEIQIYTEAVGQLGGIFAKIAGSSFEARDSLIELAGGIGVLMERSRSFVQNYYSQDEQAGIQAQSLKTALTSLGLGDVALSSRDDFRALVESRDVNTEEGRKQLVGLLNLADSFATLSNYLTDNATNLDALAASAPQVQVLQQQTADASAAAVSLQQQVVDNSANIVTEMQGLRADLQAGQAAIAGYNNRVAKVLESWDVGGSLATTPA